MQSKFTRLHISDATKEVDVFLQSIDTSVKRKVVTDSERRSRSSERQEKVGDRAHRGCPLHYIWRNYELFKCVARTAANGTSWTMSQEDRCSVHSDVYTCRGRNCWEEHMQEVRLQRETDNAFWTHPMPWISCAYPLFQISFVGFVVFKIGLLYFTVLYGYFTALSMCALGTHPGGEQGRGF